MSQALRLLGLELRAAVSELIGFRLSKAQSLAERAAQLCGSGRDRETEESGDLNFSMLGSSTWLNVCVVFFSLLLGRRRRRCRTSGSSFWTRGSGRCLSRDARVVEGKAERKEKSPLLFLSAKGCLAAGCAASGPGGFSRRRSWTFLFPLWPSALPLSLLLLRCRSSALSRLCLSRLQDQVLFRPVMIAYGFASFALKLRQSTCAFSGVRY